MRLLTMLAIAVLLAACVHDTDDFTLVVAESGASLTYYIGGEKSGGEEDPWNRIQELFPDESVHTSKSGDDDPWDTIGEKFSQESVHTGNGNKNGEPEDPWDTIQEKFGVDTVHKGKTKKSLVGDDPWNTISENFGTETVHTGNGSKSGEPDDPWDTINEKFGLETVHTGSKGDDHDDPWNRINELFPLESVHTGKTGGQYFLGFEKSAAVFVSFNNQVSTAERARVVEVRGNVLKLEFIDGIIQYVIDAPATWTEGTQLVMGFLQATSKKDRPFLGVRFWRTVKGESWGEVSGDLVPEVPVAWSQDYFASGASLLVTLPTGMKLDSGADPWDTINDKFGAESVHTGKAKRDDNDDPWDTIQDNFGEGMRHTGKSHDDPWDTINESFPIESSPAKGLMIRTFKGKEIVEMLFVYLGNEKSDDDPWDTIGENFPIEKSTGAVLVLKEVRGNIGRFEFQSGRTIFAVGVPVGWNPGLAIRGETYVFDTKTMLPLIGAVVWEIVLSPDPSPKERGDVAGVGDVGGMADETGVVGGTLNDVDYD